MQRMRLRSSENRKMKVVAMGILRFAESTELLEESEAEADTFAFVDDNGDLLSEVGYIRQSVDDMQTLSLINIFSLGVLAGLLMGVILWKRF